MPTRTDSELFAKPFIVGASISADWVAHSPGKRLAFRHSKNSDVRVLARGGQTGVTVLNLLKSQDLEDRSVIIGFDLFFWDSVRGNLKSVNERLDRLAAEAERIGVPLIIGDVPELIPGFQPLAQAINEKLYALQSRSKVLRVIPLEKLYLQMMETGYVEIKGHRYTFFDLVPDGLHIGDVASDFLADLVYETIRPTQSPEISA